MVEVELVDILRIRIRDVEFSSSPIRYSNLPQCWSISWRFIYNVTYFYLATWGDRDDIFAHIVSNEARNGGIKVVVASSYVVDDEITIFVCLCPELIALALKLPRFGIIGGSQYHICTTSWNRAISRILVKDRQPTNKIASLI
uniref:Uncharacterized protein n=1 Tax=Opuntia streptacantha TaxID=393608 RepID=A0A7C8YPT6_OPUST